MDVLLEKIGSKIRDAKIFGAGYGILLAPDGLVLEHPDKSFISVENFSKISERVHENLAELGQKMITYESGFGDYNLFSTERRIYYASGSSGYVAALVFPHSQSAAAVSVEQFSANLEELMARFTIGTSHELRSE